MFSGDVRSSIRRLFTQQMDIHDDGDQPLNDENLEQAKHSAGRTIGALMKRQFLMKIRHIPSIVEIIVAIILTIMIYPMYGVAASKEPGTANPEMHYWHQSIIAGFFANQEHPRLVLMPDTDHVRNILGTTFQMIFADTGITNVEIHYTSDLKTMEDIVYTDDSNAAVIRWVNSEDPVTSAQHPQIDLMFQGTEEHAQDFLTLVRIAIAATDPKTQVIAQMNNTYQPYPTVETMSFGNFKIIVGIFAILPLFFAVLPDFQVILEDRDSRVLFIAKTMGLREAEYWFVMFISPFIISLVPYLVISIIMSCALDVLAGTSFFMFFVPSVLFIISQIWFQYFLLSFLKTGSSGKYAFIIMIVVAVLLADVHSFYTLSEGAAAGLKHFFSLFPFSAYFLVIMSIFTRGMTDQGPVAMSELTNNNSVYPIWWGWIWLAVDAALYFILFLFFNAFYPRCFGHAPCASSRNNNRKFWKTKTGRRYSRDSAKVQSDISDDTCIQVHGLTKRYTKHGAPALDKLNFYVKENEVIVVIGSNGAGKSTLVNILANGIDQTEGVIECQDGLADARKSMGVVLQDNVLVAQLSVKEHIQMFGKIKGVSDDAIKYYIQYFGKKLQMSHVMDNRAGDLSGGQKRKLCVALSMIGRPKFIIMDEPTVGVDVQARQLIWKMIAAMHSTCLVTTHALEEAETVSSRLFILSNGKIPFAATSTELRKAFQCGYVLRLDGGHMPAILDLAQSFVPEAKLSPERPDTILLPIDHSVPQFLRCLEDRKKDLEFTAYSFSIENLDDVLTRLGQSDEVHAGIRRASTVYSH